MNAHGRRTYHDVLCLPAVSHEEPDLETKEPPHDAPPGHPPDLRGDLDVRTIAVGVVVAAIMGASYPYMVLKLGFGPNVSVVAAFFGFLFLRAIDLVIGSKHYNRWQNNLAEAAGTSAAQTACMCVLLGAFDILRHNTGGKLGIELTPAMSFLWLTLPARKCTCAIIGKMNCRPLISVRS